MFAWLHRTLGHHGRALCRIEASQRQILHLLQHPPRRRGGFLHSVFCVPKPSTEHPVQIVKLLTTQAALFVSIPTDDAGKPVYKLGPDGKPIVGDDGKPVPALDGPLTITPDNPAVTVKVVNDYSFYLIPPDDAGQYSVNVEGDADLGAGVEKIQDTILLDAVHPKATQLGLTSVQLVDKATLLDDDDGSGTTTTSTTSTTTTAPTVPAPNTVTLSWTAADDQATGYVIERSIDGGSTFSEIGSVASQTFIDGSTVAATGYVYRVSAFGSAGRSAPSDPASVTTGN